MAALAGAGGEALAVEKAVLRKQMRQKLRMLPQAERGEEDARIQQQVLSSPLFHSARRVGAYLSCSALSEVCTDKIVADLLHKDCILYVPRVLAMDQPMHMLRLTGLDLDTDIEVNSMGIKEPTLMLPSGEPREEVLQAALPLDIILLPGLAFDRHGGRLGRGAGFYDKFLSSYLSLVRERSWKRPHLVALAYEAQILDTRLPMDATDVPIDAIFTRNGLMKPLSS